MKLTDAERLILHNQYEILAKLDSSQAKDYEMLRDCLSNGYEEDFDSLLPHFEPNQDPAVRQEVQDILEMFRDLTPPIGTGVKAAVKFAGFDGNEEAEHYAYARFLLEDRDLWRESKPENDDYNTHYPVLDKYKAMVEVWKDAGDPRHLTAAETAAIVAAAPYHSKSAKPTNDSD